jgi:hypothetical protein
MEQPFLGSGPAGWIHRASGDAIVVLTILVATACISVYGFDDDAGVTLLGLFAATWLTSAGDFLGVG